MKIGNSDKVHVGDDITAIGFPESDKLSATSTFGHISSIDPDRKVYGNPCFHIDLTINHGNSGGPLIDRGGRVIGINTFGFAEDGIDRFNFAIKMNAVIEFIRKNCPESIEVDE